MKKNKFFLVLFFGVVKTLDLNKETSRLFGRGDLAKGLSFAFILPLK